MKTKYIMGLMTFLVTLVSAGCIHNATKPPEDPQEPILQYIGLKDKTNVREAQNYVWEQFGFGYNPKIRLIEDYLYITTTYGLYRKSVATIDDTEWELYAFEDEPIIDFAVKGEMIIAITANRNSKAMLISTDNGRTYSEATPDSFMKGATINEGPALFVLSQNPLDPNSLLVLAYTANPELFGLLKSTDFGHSWRELRPYILGYQNRFVAFNPHDTNMLYCAGEEMIFNSVIYASDNDGEDWSLIESVDNNCVHHITFHPSNPDVMIYSGEYLVKKSTDRGKTWREVLLDEIYFYKTLYDPDNPLIVYASGCTRIPDSPHLFTIHRSTNGGDDWEVFFQTNLSGEGGIIDMEIKNNNLFLYTYTDGIFMLTIPKDQ